jgi:hypothetical protein
MLRRVTPVIISVFKNGAIKSAVRKRGVHIDKPITKGLKC